MKLLSHISIGLFFGMLFYYFLEFGFEFVILVGFASFIPDIDWAMQFKWRLGNRHRTFMHNIWAMLIVSSIGYIVFKSLLLFFGIIIGFIVHLIADSFTVRGVSWLYPYEKKLHFNGKLSMSDEREKRREKFLQIILFTTSGFLFLIKEVSVNLFSLEGIITIAVLVFVGYKIMQKFGKAIQKTIRQLKL